jgi:hypothetical protein
LIPEKRQLSCRTPYRTTTEGGVKPPLHSGEEFGGFDAAGGEIGDEFAIGHEEIVVREVAGEGPGDLFKDAGRSIGFGELGGEEMNFEFFGGSGVLVADAGDFNGFGEGDAEFLAKFAGEGLLESFPGADFAAWEFPLKGRSVTPAALADEDAAVGTFDDSGDDLDHWTKSWWLWANNEFWRGRTETSLRVTGNS